MADSFVTWDLDDIVVGEPLPATIYLYIDFRFITFRAEGDTLDRNAYDRLQLKKVKQLFVQEKDKAAFEAWKKDRLPEAQEPRTEAEREFAEVRADAHRKMLDIFHSSHPNKIVSQTLSASKKLVSEVMKNPYTTKPLAQLQSFSRGTVDHSVNVSILSVYLAMNMGYSHAVILQHIGAGALLHDIGKAKVPIEDSDSAEVVEEKMKQHPSLGADLLLAQAKVPNEVQMIVAQHHENHDGTGYPKGLRGNQIYDLARIVAIANTFDGLVADGKGQLADRQRAAIVTLDVELSSRFDPQKLDKALKILKLGL